jgi:DNA polymerase-4
MGRRILHVDMDEFFAAIEKLDHPQLRGRPLLIGGSPAARGVVSTASYEARPYGPRSAMPMATAVRLCPQAVVRPVRAARYRQVSEQVFAILERFTPLIEPLSIDEAFLDVTGSQRLAGPAEQIARQIKRTIRSELGLTASLGVAPNKFLAKLASDLDKPDGLVVITAQNVREVLDPLPVGKLWGVGPAGAERLQRLGVATIGQLRRCPAAALRRALGETGEHLRRLAEGVDDRPVTPDQQAKSISQERTFAEDVAQPDELRRVLLLQVDQVARRLRRHALRARTVTLKLRYGDFTTLSRSVTLGECTDVTAELRAAAVGLLEAWRAKAFRPLRLLGVGMGQLAPSGGRQLALFEDPEHRRQRRLDRALDAIADRFGPGAVRRGPTPGEGDPSPAPRRDHRR